MMKHKNIKQYAILHLVFIVVIFGYYFFDLQKNVVFESDMEGGNVQVFRDENAEGTFSKEQVEEILVDILIPLEEDIPVEGSSLNLSLSKEERKAILEKHLKDERVQVIMEIFCKDCCWLSSMTIILCCAKEYDMMGNNNNCGTF